MHKQSIVTERSILKPSLQGSFVGHSCGHNWGLRSSLVHLAHGFRSMATISRLGVKDLDDVSGFGLGVKGLNDEI